MGEAINQADFSAGTNGEAVLSLIFAKGARPDADAVCRWSEQDPKASGFSVSHRPSENDGWLELLASGLAFDCTGLAPGSATSRPERGTLLGLDAQPEGEAIALQPGPHLAEGAGLLPVIRVMAGLGARLAAMPGAVAVCWKPAGTWMAPDYFARIVADWLAGGAFPALGLTNLTRESNGAMVSRGLSLLIGQELRFEPDRDLPQAAAARLAIRLVHELIASGPLDHSLELTGPGGELLHAVPVRDGSEVRVMVRRQP